jgi:hypothetical protein
MQARHSTLTAPRMLAALGETPPDDISSIRE